MTPSHLLRAALIVVLAVGVLSMHGLVNASSEPHESVVHAGLAAGHDSGHETDGDHGDLAHAVAVCIWLLVATGASITAAAVARRLGFRVLASTALASRASKPMRAPSARSPDPPPAAPAPLLC